MDISILRKINVIFKLIMNKKIINSSNSPSQWENFSLPLAKGKGWGWG